MNTSARGGFNSGGMDRFVGRDGFKLRWNEHVCSRWIQFRWNAQIFQERRIQIALECTRLLEVGSTPEEWTDLLGEMDSNCIGMHTSTRGGFNNCSTPVEWTQSSVEWIDLAGICTNIFTNLFIFECLSPFESVVHSIRFLNLPVLKSFDVIVGACTTSETRQNYSSTRFLRIDSPQ